MVVQWEPGMKKVDKNRWTIRKNICIVKLTQNKVMLIDIEDMAILNDHIFCARDNKHTFYAITNIEGKSVGIHRIIMNPEKDKIVDHINHCGLNNLRSNLRIVTHSENSRNMTTKNKSGVRGLTISNNSWKCTIINEKGERETKWYSIKKYGEEEAKKKIVEWRKDKEKKYGYLSL